MLPALVSPPVVFAIERANVDLVLFALTMLVINLMERSFLFRTMGYAVAEVAALLKYYPIVLIVLAAQERMSRAILIVLLGALAFAAYIWTNWALVREIIEVIPLLSNGSIGFGADLLVQRVGDIAYQSAGIHLPFVIVKSTLIAAVVATAFAISLRPAMSNALKGLVVRELHCLIAGSLLLCFCFFATLNVGYREIFALLILPGLIASAEASTDRWAAIAWGAAADAVLLLMWTQPTVLNASPESVAIGYVIIRETIWWIIVTLLLAAAICFLGFSPTWRQFSSRCRHAH
jgi:hypothetical protein